MSLYLDSAATTPLLPEVRECLIQNLDVYANPSSTHHLGQKAGSLLRDSRQCLASALNCSPTELYFCSSGTEANNWIAHIAKYSGEITTFFHSAVEHPSLHFAAKRLFPELDALAVAKDGKVDASALEAAVIKNSLVSCILVNNESGIIQNLKELYTFCRERECYLHVDATQALGKIEIQELPKYCDYATFSAHKIGGPKGQACLYRKENTPFISLLEGGPQELGFRAGTENVAAISAFALAGEIAVNKQKENFERLSVLYAQVYASLKTMPGVVIHSLNSEAVDRGEQSPAIINFALKSCPADIALIRLDAMGYSLSAGSACSSGSNQPSRILTAMGLEKAEIKRSLRLSLSPSLSESAMEAFLADLSQLNKEL